MPSDLRTFLKITKKWHPAYYVAWFSLTGAILLSAASFNIFVDPYGIWPAPRVHQWNWSKPKQNLHQRLFRAADIAYRQPTTVILGSSRVIYSLSPQHPALSKYQPAYNSGLSSANMYEELRYFQHALYHQPDLKLVIIGLDFFSFNRYIKNRPDFSESRLARPFLLSSDSLVTTLSWSVLLDSRETLKRNQATPDVQLFSRDGFGQYPEELKETQSSGYRLKAFEHSITSHFRSPEVLGTYQISEFQLANFQKIVDICRKQNIELRLFISPTHVADLEAIYAAGLWPEFENWKRRLVEIAPIWDFSGYTSINSEKISDQMLNYWDSHHYRRRVGDKILNTILDSSQSSQSTNWPITPLTQRNIEQRLQETREVQNSWRAQNQSTVEWVQNLKKMHRLPSDSN